MVAKKLIIKIMEEVLGEFILNIPPQNLQVAVLRGKIKLANVQLDGDLLSSHLLSTLGLPIEGFAVLSCTAERLKADIPWSKLEKEPTLFELSGLQLVCVPLLPSNANKVFGSGTKIDPRCTLRTRVKRSALARFERNFFSWRIEGEGPTRPIQRERNGNGNQGRGRRRGRRKDSKLWDDQSAVNQGSVFTMDMNMTMDGDAQSQFGQREFDTVMGGTVVANSDGNANIGGGGNENQEKEMSYGQRNVWREKMKKKLLRNIQITIKDIHVRCEVGENALDLRHDRNTSNGGNSGNDSGVKSNSTSRSRPSSSASTSTSISESSSFSFGIDVDTLQYKSANSNWQTGKNVDWTVDEKNGPKNALGQPQPEKRHNILEINNFAMYWDDRPPVLLSESSVFKFAEHQLSEHKVLTIIRKAMEKLRTHQDPGSAIRQLLDMHNGTSSRSLSEHRRSSSNPQSHSKLNHAGIERLAEKSIPRKDHVHLVKKSSLKLRLEFTNHDHLPNNQLPNICSAEITPCQLDLSFSPQQLRQRRLLEYTMIGQRRLDTMLHQRPLKRPTKDPRGWWRYVISCVMTCPNKRPWRDVKRIVAKRAEYVAIVEKKHLRKGLNEQESAILLKLEDMLPIETLLAFHLIALRNVVEKRERKQQPKGNNHNRRSEQKQAQDDDLNSFVGGESVMSEISRKSGGGTRRRSRSRSRRRSRSRSRTKKDLEVLVATTVHRMNNISMEEEKPRQAPSIPRSPLSKMSAMIRKKGKKKYSPSKENQGSMRTFADDNASVAESVGSFDFQDAEPHSIDFGGIVPMDDEIVYSPPMIRMIRGYSVTIKAALLDRVNGDSVLTSTLNASLWAKHSLAEGSTFLFDIKRLDCLDGTEILQQTKVLTFDAAVEPEDQSDDNKSNDDTSELTLPFELHSSFDDDNFLDTFCNQMNEEEMPLPPRGTACRLLIALGASSRSISLSAHAATLIWKTRCIRTFMDSFFPNQSQEARSIIRTQLRNAATPLALKAQVALVSPKSMSIKVNIDAPKIWFPVSQNASDGALFIDSGRLNMSLRKPELVSNIHWSINSNGIFAKFRQHDEASDILEYCGSEGIPILSPFDFTAESDRCGEGPALVKTTDGVAHEQSTRIHMSFTAIIVNLVDVEVLALAIGRWYAAEMSSLKKRAEKKGRINRLEAAKENTDPIRKLEEELTVSIERVELYCQGQVSQKPQSGGKKKYRIQISKLDAKHCKQGGKEYSTIKVGNASIIQESSETCSDRQFEASKELHHRFLTCLAQKQKKRASTSGNDMHETSALAISVLRDEKQLTSDFDVTFGRLVVRLTPTLLTDCSTAIGRIIESTQIMTKEMERRVHGASRKVIISESQVFNVEDESLKSKTLSNDPSVVLSTVSSYTLNRYALSHDQSSVTLNTLNQRDRVDSTFIVKVAVKDATIQIGWDEKIRASKNDFDSSRAQSVVQFSFRILLMFQSSENLDGGFGLGKRIIHASFDDLWIGMIKDFAVVSIRRCKPILSPLAFEFRSVCGTKNFGDVESQEFALDSDSIDISLEKHNLMYLADMSRSLSQECRSLGSKVMPKRLDLKQGEQKSSIATTIGFQFQPWSLTLLSKMNAKAPAVPLLQTKGQANGNIDGCMNAFSGDFRLDASMSFFSRNIDDWVLLMENLPLTIDVEYQSKEVGINATFEKNIFFNVTSEMLERLSEEIQEVDEFQKEPSVESVKQRIKITNNSGVNFVIAPMRISTDERKSDLESLDSSMTHSRGKSLKDGDSEFISDTGIDSQVGLILNEDKDHSVGLREALLDIPLHFSRNSEIFYLIPKEVEHSNEVSIVPNIEPIIEYCIQNQRLRSAFSGASNLENGADLLSSQTWSPSDQIYNGYGNHWLHPYLDDDVPEWSDTTFSLKLDKDRSVLPDNGWIWLNDWEVDVSGAFDKEIDADGWDYAQDFRRLSGNKRFYEEGDMCRRRRWTRTRIMKEQLYDQILRPIPLAWSYVEEEGSGYKHIRITSHVRITNNTERKLSIFGHKYSWDRDMHLGDIAAKEEFALPIQISSITHIRLGIIDDKQEKGVQEYRRSKRLNILSSSNSVRLLRTKIYLDTTNNTEELLASRSLHFLISIDSSSGLIKISIEPVMKIVNFLPCSIHYRLVEAARQIDYDDRDGIQKTEKMLMTEENEIATGAEGSSLTVDPSLNPSVSFRMPGYHWSSYRRIVNRRNAEMSWNGNTHGKKYTIDQASEQSGGYIALVEFQSLIYGGDPLTIILEVSPGHCPSLQIYAQYWMIDMSGFGLRFCDGASDILGANLSAAKNRRSYSTRKDNIKFDGHEWAIGKNGMSLYFSENKKIAVAVDIYRGDMSGKPERNIRSAWSRLLDISNVMPKTAFFVDEVNSPTRYDLCYNVTTASGAFARTKIVRIFSRFHVMNVSSAALYLVQEGCPGAVSFVPPKGSVPFHFEDSTKPLRIRLSTNCVNWSRGSVSIDKVGITSVKLHDTSEMSPVLQVEVRLATEDQNGAVAVLIWNSQEQSQPLYVLKNSSSHKILCCQQVHKEDDQDKESDEEGAAELNPFAFVFGCTSPAQIANVTACVTTCGPIAKDFEFTNDSSQWLLQVDDQKHFGFDYPQRAHVLEWIVPGVGMASREKIDIDRIGSQRIVTLSNGTQVGCFVRAEGSSKIIEFMDLHPGQKGSEEMLELFRGKKLVNDFLNDHSSSVADMSDNIAVKCKVAIPAIAVSLIETYLQSEAGREILFASMDKIVLALGKTAEGYHEMELKVSEIQIDNHLPKAAHPILMSFPHHTDEPVLHISVVRKIRDKDSSFFYKYVAVRLLDVNLTFDRSTIESISKFADPVLLEEKVNCSDTKKWIHNFTQQTSDEYRAAGLSFSDYAINTDRLYIEELHIHPTRITLTFAQDYSSHNTLKGPQLLQYLRLVPSITDASLILTSFVVSRAFESPSILKDIIRTHYKSQVTQHFFSLIGSLAILTGPADFLQNIGTGVRDFFYEPINGLVHGPAEFIEGLENGSISLVRGVFVGVVRGAANVTGVLNSNLINLTDKGFIDERSAYHRSLLELNRRSKPTAMTDVMALAGESVAHGVVSGAKGLYEEPFENFNKQGTAGFVKGMGQALVKAVVKPIVGIGDGAILMMQHVTDATDDEVKIVKSPKRLRRALPRKPNKKRNGVLLLPYDEKSAIVQNIVSANDNNDDAYMSHMYTERYLLIASEQYLWIIERRTNEQEQLLWETISHFRTFGHTFMHIIVFTKLGLKPKIIEVDSSEMVNTFGDLLSMQKKKMMNAETWTLGNEESDFISTGTEYKNLAGLQKKQSKYVFGSMNCQEFSTDYIIEDEIQIIENCYEKIVSFSSSRSTFFSSLDEEAWGLINGWKKLFSGISSKHCLVAGFVNCTDNDIQIKSTILLEGGSPCCHIPSRDYDELNNLLKPGGAIIFFSWGVPPNLNNEGRIHLRVETNAFVCNLLDRHSPLTSVEMLPGCQDECVFLEKSISGVSINPDVVYLYEELSMKVATPSDGSKSERVLRVNLPVSNLDDLPH